MPSQVELSLISTLSLLMPAFSYNSINLFALAIDASLSKESLQKVDKIISNYVQHMYLASTSVDTRPGTIFKISTPKLTY